MGIFQAILSKHFRFDHSHDDLIQFMAGAAFGCMFLYCAVWTWSLIVLV